MSDYTVIAPVTLETGLAINAPVTVTGQVVVSAPISLSEISIQAPVTVSESPIINAPVSTSGTFYVVAPITIQGGLGPAGPIGPTGATGEITNAIINSGIADNPAATRSSLELGSAALAETGDFYPSSNPSGYITGVDLSAYVTGAVVRPSETGSFITSSQTGAFYAATNPSGYTTTDYVTGISGYLQSQITGGSVTGGYYPLNSNPSGYVTGDVVRPSETGQFYPASNPSGFATGIDISSLEATYYPKTNPSGFVTISGSWFGLATSWTVEPTLITGISGGDVYNYVYGGTTYYRFVPEPYVSTGDAFYSSFSNPTLSGLIVARGVSI